jgi:protocatechuate 3,4-dioxygenase beta subunit
MATCVFHFAFETEGTAERIPYSLTTKLPFDDDEFDHVHVKDIARGVPESKVRFRVIGRGGSGN